MDVRYEAVRKLNAGAQELEDALVAYFAGRYYSAIVLASASDEVLAGYVKGLGLTSAYDATKSAIVKIANGLSEADDSPTTDRDIIKLMNHAYNNLKHGDAKDSYVHIDPKFEANIAIERALSNYNVLFTSPRFDLPVLPLASRFDQESVSSVQAGAVRSTD